MSICITQLSFDHCNTFHNFGRQHDTRLYSLHRFRLENDLLCNRLMCEFSKIIYSYIFYLYTTNSNEFTDQTLTIYQLSSYLCIQLALISILFHILSGIFLTLLAQHALCSC